MKIYTKTGDAGETGLLGGVRVAKDHVRIQAYGDIDELNSLLGLARCENPPATIDALLASIQHALFSLGAELATLDPAARNLTFANDEQTAKLEAAVDEHEATLAPLREFILPGGSKLAATLHLARTVCRRAERHVVTLASSDTNSDCGPAIIYLNRLSDLLFVLARAANQAVGVRDVAWRKA